MRPWNVLSLPSSRGGADCSMRSPPSTKRAPAGSPRRGRSIMPAVVSSSSIPPGCVRASMRAPRSMISPSTTRAETSPRPVATQMEASGRCARSVSAHCAARSARSIAPPAPHCVTTSERPGSSMSWPPYASSAASSSACGFCAVTTSGSPANTTVTRRASFRVMEKGARSEAAGSVGAGTLVASAEAGGPRSISSSASSSRASASVPEGRSFGAFAIMRATRASSGSGRSGRTSRTRGVSWSTILASTAIGVTPSNAARPVRHSKSTHPSEKTSERGSLSPGDSICSGAM